MIVLVAAFNIVSSLVMLVRADHQDGRHRHPAHHRRDARCHPPPVPDRRVGDRRLGAAIGVALGLAFALNIEAIRQWLQHTFGLVLFDETLYLLAEMPAHITWQEVATIAGMAVVFALVASLYPAARAARLDRWKGCAVSDAQVRRGERTVERWLAWRYLASASARASSPSSRSFP